MRRAVGAAGVLAGVLARDVAAAALLALLVTLPFLLAGLIPGDVSPILDAFGALFPFDAMVDALAGILYDPSPWEALGRGPRAPHRPGRRATSRSRASRPGASRRRAARRSTGGRGIPAGPSQPAGA